eukprot:5079641-Amphidinium_carterae.1
MATPCYTMQCGSSNNVPIAVAAIAKVPLLTIRAVNIVAVLAMRVARVMASMVKKISPNSPCYFDMVAKLARAIVNRASQLWVTIVLLHRWAFRRAIWTCGFCVGTICAYLDGATGNDSDNDSDSDDV